MFLILPIAMRSRRIAVFRTACRNFDRAKRLT